MDSSRAPSLVYMIKMNTFITNTIILITAHANEAAAFLYVCSQNL